MRRASRKRLLRRKKTAEYIVGRSGSGSVGAKKAADSCLPDP